MNTENNSDIESSSDKGDHDLAMLPPIEKANAEIDMDSDASDDMNDGLVHHLLDKGNKQKSVQRTQSPNKKLRKSAARNWKKGIDLHSTLKLSEASSGGMKRNNQVTY